MKDTPTYKTYIAVAPRPRELSGPILVAAHHCSIARYSMIPADFQMSRKSSFVSATSRPPSVFTWPRISGTASSPTPMLSRSRRVSRRSSTGVSPTWTPIQTIRFCGKRGGHNSSAPFSAPVDAALRSSARSSREYCRRAEMVRRALQLRSRGVRPHPWMSGWRRSGGLPERSLGLRALYDEPSCAASHFAFYFTVRGDTTYRIACIHRRRHPRHWRRRG